MADWSSGRAAAAKAKVWEPVVDGVLQLSYHQSLLVADEILIRFVLSEELQELGWDVTEVATADEAIGLLSSGSEVDLFITDVNMPGKTDGFDLARVAREELPNVKIAIITGRLHPTGSELCDRFLRKPFMDAGTIFRDLVLGYGQQPTPIDRQSDRPSL